MEYENKTREQLIDELKSLYRRIDELEKSKSKHKAEKMLNKRYISLTEPLETKDISFADLFNIEEIQEIQDTFAEATNVASIITYPDGTPITKPSNFCHLCKDIIRKTERGLANCFYSDSIIGKHNPEGPNVQLCLSGGLWDAGASITVGGKHIANWMIGQVKNETIDEEKLIQYAGEIGADKDEFGKALHEVPVMSVEQFKKIAEVLFQLANELSLKAYQNIQQARFIAERKQTEVGLQKAHAELEQLVEDRTCELRKVNEQLLNEIEERKWAEKALQKNETRLRNLINASPDFICLKDREGRWLEANEADLELFCLNDVDYHGKTDLELANYTDPIFRHAFLTYEKSDRQIWQKGSMQGEEIITRPDGTKKIFDVIKKPIFDEHDNPHALVVLGRDITKRKQAEEALRASEERFRALYEDNPSMYFTVDVKGIVLSVNRFGAEQLGYTVQELVDQSVLKVFYEEDRKAAILNIKRCVENLGYVFQWELRKVRKDGSMLWVEETARAIKGINDKILVFIVCGDISERKQLENALKEREVELKAIIESSPDAIVVTDLKGNILDCNQATLDLHGFNLKEELIGFNAGILIIPEDRERMTQNMIKMLKDGPVKNIEYTALTKEGDKFPIEHSASVIFDNYDKPKALIGVAKDITERKKAEKELKEAHDNLELKVQERTKELIKCNIQLESDIDKIKRIDKALRESEEKFRALAENSPDIISRFDKELKYIYINHGSSTIGLLPEDFIGKKLEEIAPTGEITQIWGLNAIKVLKTGKAQEMEYEFPSIHGLKIYHSYIIPEYNEEGEIETLLAVCHDITKRKQLEGELKETVDELKRSNEELQQFAYVSSHDLQEPLRTITNFTQLLERRYKDKLDSDADEFIEYIVDAAKRMQILIKDLLEYSRVATMGKEFKLTDTEKTLNQTLSNLKILIEENKAVITYDQLPEIMADKRQIVQLFQNLIGNAIKFRKLEIPPKIHVSASLDEKRNEYVFSVTDNGIGMESQYLERIFVIFKRLHTREEYSGTGIGLAISKKVVERHGGIIWAESKLGKGSTFYFTIPTKQSLKIRINSNKVNNRKLTEEI